MSISKVVSFLSSAGSTPTTGKAATRIRRAVEEPVPLEQLVHKLRQMFTGPHERLCEARFDEILDILDEQKSATEDDLGTLAQRISTLNQRLEEDHNHITDFFSDALAKSRAEFEQKIEALTGTLRNAIEELDERLRGNLRELSKSMTSRVEEEEGRRSQDRQDTLTALEQRIAQWRAESEDQRRGDMEVVASSMMDIGQRLMVLRPS
jgi:type I site-specific restriction-modification system R (restriction) subunit